MIVVYNICKQKLHYANQPEAITSGRQECGVRVREFSLRDTGR